MSSRLRLAVATEEERAAAIAEIAYVLSPKHQEEYSQARAAVPAAIAQLQRSERGRRVLGDFKILLRNGGSGLDYKNWAALRSLVQPEDQQSIDAALAQLRKSNRGCQALKDFVKLFENGGDNLDVYNLKALDDLCSAEGHIGAGLGFIPSDAE